jgi:hypothetical protein
MANQPVTIDPDQRGLGNAIMPEAITPEVITPPAITPAEAYEKLAECYRKGSSDTFLNSLLYKARNPLEPIDENGKRKYHPLIYTLLIVIVAGVATFVYFTMAG